LSSTLSSMGVSIIAGAAVALLSFGLAELRDALKSRRQDRARKDSARRVARASIELCMATLRKNRDVIADCRGCRERGERSHEPLRTLDASGLATLRETWFNSHAAWTDAGARLGTIEFRTYDLNERIRAREAFRANNQALQGYHDTIEAYDDALLGAMTELGELLEQARGDLGVKGPDC
jgi:hypothetical protein